MQQLNIKPSGHKMIYILDLRHLQSQYSKECLYEHL